MKTRPEKAKKYNYIKDCKEHPREICDQGEKKSIQLLCEFEMKTCPKKTKKFSYIKDYKEQPRVICDQCDVQPLCDAQERMIRADETNRK